DTINALNILTVPNGNIIAYPLTVEHTVFPPSGSPIIINNTIGSGNPFAGSVTALIPYFNAQTYSYNIKITDACGNIYHSNGNVVLEEFSVSLSTPPVGCNDKKLVVSVSNYIGPFTVNFISAPAGFDPGIYNGQHPGPFSPDATYYNASTQLLP